MNPKDVTIKEALIFESINDMNYVTYCFTEALRYFSPVACSGLIEMKQDLHLKPNLTVRKGDSLCVHMHGLHRNPKQWIKPEEYIPERFDPESPYFLTPDGKKREIASFMPFLLGRRICFGKTFAETMGRATCAMLLTEFDLSFEDPDCYNYHPGVGIGELHAVEMFFNLRAKNK